MKILMDCDGGRDDALALQLLCRSPHRLLGVSTCFGGFPSQQAAIQAQEILQKEGKKIPVCAGANRSLTGERGPVHSDEAAEWQGSTMAAGRFLSDQLSACTDSVTMLATGPLTNVAAMLRSTSIRPSRIVVMGGGIHGGNRTKAAEFNFYCDPEAAKEVLQSGCTITLLPLEAAAACVLTEDSMQSFPPEIQMLMQEQMTFSLRTGCGSGNGAVLYDAVAAAGLIAPEVFARTRKCFCTVDCSKHPDAGALRITDGDGPIALVEYADPERFFRLLTALLS